MEKVEKIERVELPCSTSFLLTVNFDYLKECIDFFHKHINILYEKINDLNKKYKNFEDLKNDVKENKIKTESGLRLLNELDNRISNYGQNILKNSEKSYSNEQKIKALQEEIEKLKKLNPSGDGPDLSKLEESLKELKEEVDQSNYYNRDNIDKLNKKAIELEEKIEKLEGKNNNDKISYEKISSDEKKDEENNNLNENKNGSDNDDTNKRLNELTRRVEILEMNMSKSGDKNIEFTPSKSDVKVTEIKETKLNDAGNDNISNLNTDSIEKKLKEFSDKINKLEKDIKALRSNGSNNININLPLSENDGENENNLNDGENNNNEENNKSENKNEQNESEEKKDGQNQEITPKEAKGKDNRYILEIMSQISQLNNRLNSDDLLKRAEFNKYVQKIELQLKDYNEKFNKIFQKDALRNKLIEDMSKNNKNTGKKTDNGETKIITGNTGNYVTLEMFEDFEEKFPDLIVNYLSEFDFSSNPSIEKLQKMIDENRNMIKELSSKIDEIVLNNTKNNEYYNDVIDNLKKDVKNNIKKVETDLDRLNTMKDDLDFLRQLILGQEEDAKYQKMTKEEKKNELLIGTSIKEELGIQSNYLKKLSEGLNKVNSRINNLNKEFLAMIKKDLKNESNLILEDFKSGLKDSIGKIERQLKDKVDKLGLDEFWNKINDQLISGMKEKIDKKELNKNNLLLKRKIDNLESKISRTLVDTLIDLQMDETPLVVKRNYRDIRDITGPKCASCGQNLPNGININNGMISSSSDFTGLQNKAFKHYNISEKDKLPDIKQNVPK